jgi:hypothetical protein
MKVHENISFITQYMEWLQILDNGCDREGYLVLTFVEDRRIQRRRLMQAD